MAMEAFWWWPSGDVPEVSSQQLHVLLTDRASAPQVLDVRTAFEWSESRIAGSVNVPVTELKCRLQTLTLNKARPVVAICGHAIRSIPAVRLLREEGFRDVCQLQGGMAAWNEAGLPVVEGPSAPMERANQPAPDMKVTLSDGTSTWLNSFWKRGTLALVFIRHFGCPFARRQVTLLRCEQDRLTAAGVAIVLVGSGTPAQGEIFRRELVVPFPIICDPDRVLFKEYGLKEMTMCDVVSPLILAKTVKVIFDGGYGHKFGQGSESQLGGAFIIDSGGKIRFVHRATDAADHPSADDILQAAATPDEQSGAKPRRSTRKTLVRQSMTKPKRSTRRAS